MTNLFTVTLQATATQLSRIAGALAGEPVLSVTQLDDFTRTWRWIDFMLAPDFAKRAIARHFPLNQWGRAATIMNCESGFAPAAHCLNCAGVEEDSRGLFQINVNAHPWAADWNLFDPDTNARAARRVYDEAGGSWEPWSCAKRLGITS